MCVMSVVADGRSVSVYFETMSFMSDANKFVLIILERLFRTQVNAGGMRKYLTSIFGA